VIGHIVADRAGHAMHTALVSRLLRDRSLWEETTEPGEPEETPEELPATAAHTAREAN
jgi:UDP-3-O-[3-hydroxymyristoyl] N-acetylglucosamine deacetylase